MKETYTEVPTYVFLGFLEGGKTTFIQDTLEDKRFFDGEKTLPAKVKILEKDEHHTRCEVTISEGRNRQIKKMFEAVGKEVEFLKRIAVGEIRLGGLQRGKWRFLNEKEMEYLESLK